jgi:DNA repair exonuclease SbcCD nuclease subunit
MTTDFRQDYGETEFHYIDIGHVHHRMVARSTPASVIESWNNLAAADKYAHDGGYRSRQMITMVLRSRTYGEVGRRRCPGGTRPSISAEGRTAPSSRRRS